MRFQILEPPEIDQIVDSAFQILQDPGVKVHSDRVLNYLKNASVHVEQGLVQVPPKLVRQSIESCPKQLALYSRGGDSRLELDLCTPYFGNGSDVVYIEDPVTGERRKWQKEDVSDFIRVCDSLNHIDFVMPPGIIGDMKAKEASLHAFQATMLNTDKPIIFTALDRPTTRKIIEMASVVREGKEELAAKPYIVHYVETTSPLSLSKDAAEMLLESARSEIPLVCAPGPIGGATAPATLSGVLTQHVAESLFEVTLAQVINPGTPTIFGGAGSILDMETAVSAYGGPEFILLNSALTEVAHSFDLPMFGTAGCSDAKQADNQATIESAISGLTQGLSGADLVHDVGYIDSGMTSSYGQLVMTDEIISFIERVREGITVDNEHLGVEVIQEVGPEGNFLTHSHTLQYFRKEHWVPKFMTRQNYETWLESGSPDYRETVMDRVVELLEVHEPPSLGDSQIKEINKVVQN